MQEIRMLWYVNVYKSVPGYIYNVNDCDEEFVGWEVCFTSSQMQILGYRVDILSTLTKKVVNILFNNC